MPQTGHFVLHSNAIPTTTAGSYELISTQDGLPFNVSEEHTHVTVAAPRYVMPTDQILSSFPPANAEGAFSDRLPQIVLKRRTLPWERNPFGLASPSPVPWLALVVVAEGEGELSGATKVAECVTPGTPLLEPTDKDVEQGVYLTVTQTVLDKIFPCQVDLELLVHVREVDINDTELANGDDDGWLAVVLANRLPVYDNAGDKPVRYMACLVNVEGQLPNLPQPKPFVENFKWEVAQDWSVLAQVAYGPDPRVMGGVDLGTITLPAIGGLLDAAPEGVALAPAAQAAMRVAQNVGVALDGASSMGDIAVAPQWSVATEKVAAVALDPDAKLLVRDAMGAGFRYPIGVFAIEKTYRFPVLAHWSFTTTTGDTFETLMQGLDVGLIGTEPAVKPPAPGKPLPAPPAREKPEVVGTGHIGLGLRTRRGDATRAWYRGPLVPFPTVRDAPVDGKLPVAHSADQIRPVVPDGREDLSLAAAFEIGRLLGLSQLSIVSALLRFRKEQFGIGRVRELLDAITAFEIPVIDGQRVDLGRFVALHTLGEMAGNPVDFVGPRRPIADPGRELIVRGDLDEVIASGLGLDLAAVRKAGEQVGLVAALGSTNVPVASAGGRIELDGAGLSALRGALATEVNRIVGIAVPQQVIGDQPPGRRRRQAAPVRQPDALDALIDRAERQAAAEEQQ
jgi:hypothetical protein